MDGQQHSKIKLKQKKASFENFLISSKRESSFLETDRGKEFYNIDFQNFLNYKNIKLYSRNTYLGAVFAERFDRTIKDLHKQPVFKKQDGNWIDVLPTITKQLKNRVHSSTMLTPIQASLRENEGFVCNNLLNKRKKLKPKFQLNDLIRVADLKKTFSKGDTTKWSYKLYKIKK